jgi:hypothetical protein
MVPVLGLHGLADVSINDATAAFPARRWSARSEPFSSSWVRAAEEERSALVWEFEARRRP